VYKDLVASSLSYSAHMVSNPIIEVDGEKATGDWYVLVPCTGRAQNVAAWIQGRYEEEYVKENGEWKWKSITARFDHITPFDEGWSERNSRACEGEGPQREVKARATLERHSMERSGRKYWTWKSSRC